MPLQAPLSPASRATWMIRAGSLCRLQKSSCRRICHRLRGAADASPGTRSGEKLDSRRGRRRVLGVSASALARVEFAPRQTSKTGEQPGKRVSARHGELAPRPFSPAGVMCAVRKRARMTNKRVRAQLCHQTGAAAGDGFCWRLFLRKALAPSVPLSFELLAVVALAGWFAPKEEDEGEDWETATPFVPLWAARCSSCLFCVLAVPLFVYRPAFAGEGTRRPEPPRAKPSRSAAAKMGL